MKQEIWKWRLTRSAEQTIEVPRGAQPLSWSHYTVWMLVDPEAPVERVTIRAYGPGLPHHVQMLRGVSGRDWPGVFLGAEHEIYGGEGWQAVHFFMEPSPPPEKP